MSDDKSKTVAKRKRINIREDYALHFWSKKFGVSHNELRRTVGKVSLPMISRARHSRSFTKRAISFPVAAAFEHTPSG
jgi:Protein of unknown function (DUF3606)